jgi:putative two-component system response regulator
MNNLKDTILVIDDTSSNLILMGGVLKDDYNVKLANSGERGLGIAFGESLPDLILLDIMMPEMDGYEVCTRLKNDSRTCNIPIIFLTAKNEIEDEQYGLELGAVDYICKPITPALVLARLKNHLALKKQADFLREKSDFLEFEVHRRTEEIIAIQDVTIQIVTSLAETRDPETGNHIRRTQFYVKALAEHLKTHPRFFHLLNQNNIEMIYKSAPLHDVGKVGIPDNVLLKPGKLEFAEFEIMKTHAMLGYDAIKNAEKTLGINVSFLKYAKEIAYSHHEKWDGTGYPQGLAGDEIPFSARLMAVADVYDAMTCKRVYKEAISHNKVIDIMRQECGSHFDPDIFNAFLEIEADIIKIAKLYTDD